MLFRELSQTQKSEVMRQVGDAHGISPEGVSHAIEGYLDSLKHQAEVAKAFFFGRLEEGFEGLLELPDDVRVEIDQLIWEGAGGSPIDPTEPESEQIIAAAIVRSMERRMGMEDQALN